MQITRESMEFDIVIVGAGPAGLACGIRLAQLNQSKAQNLSICIIEKGAAVGAHILSGNVFEPNALNELIPDWQEKEAPLNVPVTEDHFIHLTEHQHRRLPTPPGMKNNGNFIISLGKLCQWLAEVAEGLGVNIFPGFAAAKTLHNEQGQVIGVQTGDMGLDKKGNPTARLQAGIQLFAKQTILAEGCRGSLTEKIIKQFNLREHCDPQSYAIGIKELWKINPEKHQPGSVMHTIGWPLDNKTYGGSFLYHYENNLLSLGFVIGLDYTNPYLDPFQELQRFKTHPLITPLLSGGECIGYGARALNEGGWQAIPRLSFPGGLIIGCGAGFLNVAQIKGSHNAMRSGMLAAETIFNELEKLDQEYHQFNTNLKNSAIYHELYQVRNIRPAFHKGLWAGLIYSAFDQYLLRGKAPWTFHYQPDYQSLKLAKKCQKIAYPKPDHKITFDRTSQVYLSATNHQENQPCHLKLKDPDVAITVNLAKYDAPEQRYCPAGVYEIVEINKKPQLQINAPNCIHCKTCDIKDPTQNIIWETPEGGEGPNYNNM